MPKSSQLTGTPRPAIANLLRVVKQYKMKPTESPTGSKREQLATSRFVLVNEKGEELHEGLADGDDYTRDELILMIGEAYPEFASLARELSEAKRDYVAACDVLRATHQAILGGRAAEADTNPAEDAGKLRSRYNQGMDVMKNILNGSQNAEQIRFLIGRYVDMNRRLGLETEAPEEARPIPLVNEKLTLDGHDHIRISGEFQSDKYPTCPPGKVPLSIKDKTAQDLLWEYAQRRRSVDADFSADLEICLQAEGFHPALVNENEQAPANQGA